MEKLDRLDAYLERTGYASVWFARPNAFAWLTGGSNVVDREAVAGVAAVGYDGERVRVLTDSIEADRVRAEELPDRPDATVDAYPWHESSLADALAERVEGPAAADVPVDAPSFDRVDPSPLRQPLTETDVERYRSLGRETAAAVEAVCREVRSDDTEREVAAALRVALSARDVDAPVVLVGGGERAQAYRHYTPTDVELGEYALVSVTASRAGLHASCTRTVAFDPPSWLDERHDAAARVETTALAATRAAATPEAVDETAGDDGTAGAVFESVVDAYEAVGAPDEWREHHQGGAAGFASREWIATPDGDERVRAPMAYAWNPTVQGAKSEDTALVTAEGIEVLTTTDDWPTRPAAAVGYDLELARPAPLDRSEWA